MFCPKMTHFDDVGAVLIYMGIPAHIKAYDYMLEALPLVAQRVPIYEIYRIVGESCGCSLWAVERGLRVAAGRSVDRMGYTALVEIYGNTLPMSGVPTVAQLLVTAARLAYGMLPYARTDIPVLKAI